MVAGGTDDPAVLEGMVNILGIIFGWIYFAVMESSSVQGTLGKMALGIKVTDLEGNQVGFGKATGRFFGTIISALILLIGFIMVAFTQKKQGLHDMMAGCLVVNKQAKFVKEKYGYNYTHRSGGETLGIAVLLTIGTVFVLAILVGSYEDYELRSSAGLASEKPTEEAYKAGAVDLDYRKALFGDYEKGAKIKFVGSVNQIIGDDAAMIQTKQLYLDYSGEPVILVFDEKPRIVTEDTVRVLGRYIGTQKYETVLGAEKEDPLVHVDYYYVQ